MAKRKLYIVIDFGDVIRDVLKYRSLYEFYALYPLKDLIETILSVWAHIDYSDCIYNEIDHRFKNDNIGIDIDLFDIFHEALAESLDNCISELFENTSSVSDIKNKYNIDINNAGYFFERWIGNTSALMRFEE